MKCRPENRLRPRRRWQRRHSTDGNKSHLRGIDMNCMSTVGHCLTVSTDPYLYTRPRHNAQFIDFFSSILAITCSAQFGVDRAYQIWSKKIQLKICEPICEWRNRPDARWRWDGTRVTANRNILFVLSLLVERKFYYIFIRGEMAFHSHSRQFAGEWMEQHFRPWAPSHPNNA